MYANPFAKYFWGFMDGGFEGLFLHAEAEVQFVLVFVHSI